MSGESQPILPRLGVKRFFGQLDGELITPGEQFPSDPYQKRADGFRFPLSELLITAHQRHPTQGVVGQNGALKQCGIGQEVAVIVCASPICVLPSSIQVSLVAHSP